MKMSSHKCIWVILRERKNADEQISYPITALKYNILDKQLTSVHQSNDNNYLFQFTIENTKEREATMNTNKIKLSTRYNLNPSEQKSKINSGKK